VTALCDHFVAVHA
jgi:hypothetical protein